MRWSATCNVPSSRRTKPACGIASAYPVYARRLTVTETCSVSDRNMMDPDLLPGSTYPGCMRIRERPIVGQASSARVRFADHSEPDHPIFCVMLQLAPSPLATQRCSHCGENIPCH